MAGVVFGPRAPSIVRTALGDLLGRLMGGMFERDKNARQYKLDARMKDEEAARAIAARDAEWDHLTNKKYPWLAENARVSRENPNVDVTTLMLAGLMGPDVAKTVGDNYKHLVPEMQMQNINLGDRNQNQVFDQRMGTVNSTFEDRGLDPSVAEDARARLGAASINAGASRYDADTRRAVAEMTRGDTGKWGVLPTSDGRYWQHNDRTGETRGTDIFAPMEAQQAKSPGIRDITSAYEALRGDDLTPGDPAGAELAKQRLLESLGYDTGAPSAEQIESGSAPAPAASVPPQQNEVEASDWNRLVKMYGEDKLRAAGFSPKPVTNLATLAKPRPAPQPTTSMPPVVTQDTRGTIYDPDYPIW